MSIALGSGSSLLAHGGTGGLLVEVGLTVGILLVFVAVWFRERRVDKRGDGDRAGTDEELFRDEESR